MRRRLLNWIALLSLFLFVLIVCLWISVAARFQLGNYYRKAMYATREPTGLGLTHQVFVGPTRFGSPRITVLFWWSRTYREYVGFRLEYGNFDDSSTIHRCLNLVIPFWAQALTVVTPAYWILQPRQTSS